MKVLDRNYVYFINVKNYYKQNYNEHILTPTEQIPQKLHDYRLERQTIEELEGPVRLTLGSERTKRPSPCRRWW